MKKLKIAKSYAKALLKTAESDHRTEAVYEDLKYLKDLLAQSAEFDLFLSPYFMTEVDRPQVLRAIFEGKIDLLTFKFLELLEKRRDLRLLPSTIEAFEEFYLRLRGIVQASIRVAYEVSEKESAAFTEKAKKLFGPETIVTIAEDASLLGGFVMETPEKVYDCSLSGRFDRLAQRLAAT
ncbi:MAG: ATP synthase F1 subunit delta [Lentisphaerae bacterium GWF2_57_35]|nr:MAG: ATP synthase F1 subunit delta [Lentisphaerae bacterium GWF2_57_35]